MVKCRIGEEKVTCLQLIRKMFAYQFTDDPLQIKSVVAPEGVKGYIYIEAYKQSHVKSAMEGISNLRLGIWRQTVSFIYLHKFWVISYISMEIWDY